jgi:hypothetical protein
MEFVPGTNLGLVLAILKQRKIEGLYSQADRSEIEIWTVIPRLHA